MESWSYVSEGKGVVTEETMSHLNPIARSKKSMLGWELKFPLAFDTQGFGALGIDPINAEIAFSGEEESSRDSPLIDLKLGRFGDRSDVIASKLSTPPKRIRLLGLNSRFRTAFCQVYGCNKDLSSSKDYHKRYRVCELHSKTAKIIVNGIEQRFCQQCSRFHLLDEFDDGKRSCRKRLAAHNERRRKSRVRNHSGRAGRTLESYNDSRFEGTTSFICQDILPGDWRCRSLKIEQESHLPSKSLFPYNAGKKLPLFHEFGANALASSGFGESTSQYVHGGLYHSSALGCEDFKSFGTINGFSGTTDSGCALSLLSSQQSDNSSSHETNIPSACPLVKLGSQTRYIARVKSLKSLSEHPHSQL